MLGIETWQVVGLGYVFATSLGFAVGAYAALWSSEPRYTPLPPTAEPRPTVRVIAVQPPLPFPGPRPYDWALDGECRQGFDEYVAEHGIAPDDVPEAFSRYLCEQIGWGGRMEAQ